MSAAGADFLIRHGGQKCGSTSAPPMLIGWGQDDEEEKPENRTVVHRDYEVPESQWKAMPLHSPADASEGTEAKFERWKPVRFVDGKDVGRTAAWLEAPNGFPIPVRVGQIGAAALLADPRLPAPAPLRREFEEVSRVVALEADFFPWHEVESFAAALHANGFRLLIARRQREQSPGDFGALENTVNKRTTEEMLRLEGRAVRGSEIWPACPDDSFVYPGCPTVLDGRLEDKTWGFAKSAAVFGVVKRHVTLDYLHQRGLQVFIRLRSNERTPMMTIERTRLKVVTWYARTDVVNPAPNEGIIRIEVPMDFMQSHIPMADRARFANWLSRTLLAMRTRDETYGRAAVTLYPVQRVEESLGACFTHLDAIVRDFYSLTGL